MVLLSSNGAIRWFLKSEHVIRMLSMVYFHCKTIRNAANFTANFEKSHSKISHFRPQISEKSPAKSRRDWFILKGVWDYGVKSGAEVYKQDPYICPWFVQMLQYEAQSHVEYIIHRPVCSVDKLQGVQQGSSGVLQIYPKPVF